MGNFRSITIIVVYDQKVKVDLLLSFSLTHQAPPLATHHLDIFNLHLVIQSSLYSLNLVTQIWERKTNTHLLTRLFSTLFIFLSSSLTDTSDGT